MVAALTRRGTAATGATSQGLSGSMRTAAWPSGSEYRRASGSAVDIVDVEDPADGLVLQPLACVAGMDAGSLGQLGRGCGTAVCERAVQAEAIAEVDGLQVEGSERGVHQAAGKPSRRASAVAGSLVMAVMIGSTPVHPQWRTASDPRAVSGTRHRVPRSSRADSMDIRRHRARTRRRQPAATASRSASGIGRWTSTGRMYAAIISRVPLTPSSVNRNENLRRCGGEDLVLRRQVPQLPLERPDRLLAGRVDELLVGLVGLALVGGVLEAPRLDLAVELLREGRVLVQRVLEPGREVDLGRLDRRESVEQLVRQGRRAVLDGAGQPVVAPRDLAELAQHLEVELDLGHAAVGQRHAAVARAGLDADLATGRRRRASAASSSRR